MDATPRVTNSADQTSSASQKSPNKAIGLAEPSIPHQLAHPTGNKILSGPPRELTNNTIATCVELELLELIQTHMVQEPMLRVEGEKVLVCLVCLFAIAPLTAG